MEPIKISERLKYYRSILDIGQKALVDENISINLIKHVEGGKRRLTIHKAMILSDRFNAIAKEKGIELNVTVKDLLMSDEEYARKVCLDELSKIDEKTYNEIKYDEILNIAQDYNLDDVIIKVFEKIGMYYYSIRDFNSALKYNEQALQLAIKIGDIDKRVRLLNTNGACYHSLDSYSKALETYEESYKMLLSANIIDRKFESKLLYNLALCNRKLKRNSEALNILNSLLTMSDFDESVVINGMIVKANIYLDEQRYEQALQLYKAISTYGPKYMYIIQHNMAYAYVKLNRIAESIDYMVKAINAQLEDESPILTYSLLNMGGIYKIENLYNQAIIFYEYAVDNAIKYCQIDLLVESCESLYMLYEKIEKTIKFKDTLYKLNILKIDMLSEDQKKIIEDMINKYSKC